jgi:glycosyltransferase involved in cell wall biosynthesis
MPLLPRRARERLTRPYVELHRKLDAISESINSRLDQLQDDVDRARAMLRHIYDEEPANRRRLYALRETDDYELAFTESEPLVSFIVPTYNNFTALREVSLPSVLGQSYSNLDVIVIGDCAPPETGQVVAEFDDPRVRYYNRTYRGPYPEDPNSRWRVIGNGPHNEAVSIARGRWIAQVSDDDAIRPHHTEALLRAAQQNRYEHCYGLQLVQFSEGEDLQVGEFPPREAQWGLQAAIYHAGLRFLGLELADALYDEPSDWALCRRMLQIGVRTGMIDDIVVDKYESRRRTADEWVAGQVPDAE